MLVSETVTRSLLATQANQHNPTITSLGALPFPRGRRPNTNPNGFGTLPLEWLVTTCFYCTARCCFYSKAAIKQWKGELMGNETSSVIDQYPIRTFEPTWKNPNQLEMLRRSQSTAIVRRFVQHIDLDYNSLPVCTAQNKQNVTA